MEDNDKYIKDPLHISYSDESEEESNEISEADTLYPVEKLSTYIDKSIYSNAELYDNKEDVGIIQLQKAPIKYSFPRKIGNTQSILPIRQQIPKNSIKTIYSPNYNDESSDSDETYHSPIKLLKTTKSRKNRSPIKKISKTITELWDEANIERKRQKKLERDNYWNQQQVIQNREFFVIPSLFLVNLPDELKNEPYSISDNGFRPEIRVKKIYYKFGIQILRDNTSKIYAIVEQGIYQRDSVGVPEFYIPEKLISYISVVDIYENYGINVTYSYLRHICIDNPISRKNPDWLWFYLETSMSVLNNNYRPPTSVKDPETRNLYLSSLLISNFLVMESEKIKLPTPITTVEQKIPFEILAKITGSKRLSKKVSDIVQHNKCINDPMTTEELSMMELDSDKYYPTLFDNNKYYCQYKIKESDHFNSYDYFEYSFKDLNTNGPYHFVLEKIDKSDYIYFISIRKIVQYPLISYRKAYARRGCNVIDIKTVLLSLLVNLSKTEVTVHNFGFVCAWIIQLSIDTDNIKEMIIKNYTGLQNILHSLSNLAIKLVQDDIL
jgi:hypothetical protein